MFGDDRKVRFKAANAVRLLPFVGMEATRYYLHGICVERYLDGVLLVATDGRRLAMIYDESGEADGTWICELPKALAAACRDACAGNLHFAGQLGHVTVPEFKGNPADIGPRHIATVYAPPIEGLFPNFRGILPKELPDHPSLPVRRLDIPDLGEDVAHVFPTADNTATYVLLPNQDDIVGLFMPVRTPSTRSRRGSRHCCHPTKPAPPNRTSRPSSTLSPRNERRHRREGRHPVDPGAGIGARQPSARRGRGA